MMLGWAKDLAGDAVGSAWNGVTSVADTAVNTVGGAASLVGSGVGVVGKAVDGATFGAASGVLSIVDDTLLDGLDDATHGIIDIDFDDGNLSAGVGIDGLASVEAGIGEDGVHHSAEALSQSYDVGLDADGVRASATAGIDFGPLPYADADVAVGANGELLVDVEAQGTIPTPYGLASGSTDVGIVRDDERFGLSVDTDGTLRRPDGSVIRGGVDVGYVETEGGSALQAGLEGSYSQPGLGTIGGSVGYSRIEQGDVVVEGFEAEADVDILGASLDAGVEMAAATTTDGTVRDWETDADVSAPELSGLGTVAGAALGDAQTGKLLGELAGASGPPATGAAITPSAHDPATAMAAVPDVASEAPRPAAVESVPDVAAASQAPAAPTEPAGAPQVATAPEPAPMPDPFDQAIAGADASEASVDDLFTDLG